MPFKAVYLPTLSVTVEAAKRFHRIKPENKLQTLVPKLIGVFRSNSTDVGERVMQIAVLRHAERARDATVPSGTAAHVWVINCAPIFLTAAKRES